MEIANCFVRKLSLNPRSQRIQHPALHPSLTGAPLETLNRWPTRALISAGLVMGKHSGRHALATRLKDLGVELVDDQLNDVFKRFKALADVKKGITDEDIIALAGDEAHQPVTIWELLEMQVTFQNQSFLWTSRFRLSI